MIFIASDIRRANLLEANFYGFYMLKIKELMCELLLNFLED